jgi:hypothetical protein
VIRERRCVEPRRSHGVEAKQLFMDAAAGYVASHVRMAAGANIRRTATPATSTALLSQREAP